ncbi:MAG: hypothetical protein WC610_03375 [Patescibacteria group bacterium]
MKKNNEKKSNLKNLKERKKEEREMKTKNQKWIISGLVFVLVFLMSNSLSAGQAPPIEWQKTFGGTNTEDQANSVQQTSDHGYIVAGWTWSFGGAGSHNDAYDAYLIKTDTNGNLLWQKTLGGINGDIASSVQQTSDNGYIVAGATYSFGAGNSDAYLIKTDSKGNLLWQKTFGGTGEDWASSVQQTSDGGYIVAGLTQSFGAGSEDVYLIKTDANGNLLWQKTLGGTNGDMASSVQQTPDNGYIIAGWTTSFGAGSYDAYLIKTDANGNLLWEKTFGGTDWDWANSVQQTSDHGYIVAGSTSSFGAGYGDVYLIKTDSNGNLLWEKTFGGISDDGAFSVQQTSDNGYIIAGEIRSFQPISKDAYLIKTDSNGELQWQKTFGETRWDWANSVQQTSDHGYIVAGGTTSFGTGSYDVYLVKIAPEGTQYPISCVIYNTSPRFSKPVQVNSVCADGSDVTLLDVSLPDFLDPNRVTLEIVESGAEGEDGSTRITQRQIGKIEAMYTAPNNFCRSGYTEDAGLKSRLITIKVVYQGEERYQFQFPLFRPPVVMLHGLWGYSTAWDGVINELVQERNLYPQDLFWNHSYYSSNASSFKENKDVCDSAIFCGLFFARQAGYSAGKVDVIAHSMGGLLVRWYLHNLGTKQKHYQGDIHKFISIGVPYSGSQLADLAMTPGYYQVLRWIFEKIDKPIDKGAIDNLRVDSPAIDVILNGDIHPENIVPSHAIATTTVYLGEDDSWVRVFYEFFSTAFRLDIDLIPIALFRESNDYVVALSSQRGGSLSTTHFEDIFHLKQLNARIVKEKIVDLLNARLSLTDFSMSGFHPVDLHFAIPFETAKFVETMKLAAETSETESVKIVSPVSGAVIDAGTVIDVKVQATGSVDRVLIAGKDIVYTKTAPPFDFSCFLPIEIIGPYNIVAVGFGANNAITTDTIQLRVSAPAQLVGFRTHPPSLLIAIEGEKADFRVLGEFSDFVRRDITSSENGTSYSIADTGIAVVVSDGVIRGIQTGETTLTISNNGLSTNLIVSVIEKDIIKNSVTNWLFYD